METIIRDSIKVSQEQLAQTIVKMAEGIMKLHGVLLPRHRRIEMMAQVIEVLNKPEITQQIENILIVAGNRPPAA